MDNEVFQVPFAKFLFAAENPQILTPQMSLLVTYGFEKELAQGCQDWQTLLTATTYLTLFQAVSKLESFLGEVVMSIRSKRNLCKTFTCSNFAPYVSLFTL